MSYYSDFDKHIIEIILKHDPLNKVVFGDEIEHSFFKIGEFALLLDNEGKYIFYAKDIEAMRKQWGNVVNVLSLVKRLEELGLIYVLNLELDTKYAVFYEGKDKMYCEKGKLYLSSERYIGIENLSTELTTNHLYKGTGIELSPFRISGVKYKDLFCVFNSFIYKTSKLEEFVQNGYKTQEELHKEQEVENANKQVIYARWTFIASVITIAISIFFSCN